MTRLLYCVTTILLLVIAFGLLGNYRINLTASSPLGIYQMRDFGTQDQAGPYVLVCNPRITGFAYRRGYLRSRNLCLLKPTIGVPGDHLHYDQNGVRLNGVLLARTAPQIKDSQGSWLAHYAFGDYVVDRAHLWLISEYSSKSYDSRYFGPVSINYIYRNAKPVWLF